MKRILITFVLLFSFFPLIGHTEASSSSQLIIINKKTNTLAFFNEGQLVRTYRVATGATRSLTPEGTFRIVTMIKNRPYYKEHIPGGDPRNPLGNRWMGLEARGTYGTTYAIHGNNNESSIGKYVSHGCVRMHNTEVRTLFSQVKLYTPVVITYSSSSFASIASAHGYDVTVPAGGSMNGIQSEGSMIEDGWVQKNGAKYFYTNGKVSTGWRTIDGKRYYFKQSGAMATGWLTYSGNQYYLGSDGVRQIGWATIGGKKYYFDQNGMMKTGWIENNGKHYYLDKIGAVQTGWQLVDGKKYFLDSSGAAKTGWMESGENKYYFDQLGVMQIGWLSNAGNWYYFNQSGMMQTGWINDYGKWYYINSNGVAPAPIAALNTRPYGNAAQIIDGGQFTLQTVSGNWYFLINHNHYVRSWLKYEDNWYYLYVSAYMADSSLKDS